ncbi:signal peptidase I [Zooshikella harenae]|uniref:Signal peptidase I n=1 Tax=Zooshikella harenae TaxID=2827238 RepID=A0ABS5ZI16_9GAMM|nr:signal peptidase I [Zooshikella harenae]MBU2713503.1 signal peptidase I [Zooshikella harenae]
MKTWFLRTWKENKIFFLILGLMFVFRSAIADWNTVPTGSMKPTILEGDRILVNKMAYDIRIPFTNISLVKRSDPIRGDIIIFDSSVSNKRLVKRVVGIPGDSVALINNELYINGEKLSYQEDFTPSHITTVKTENIMGVKHSIRIDNSGSALSSFPPVLVPKHQYLVLGDNRDNSADSRVIGFIPRDEIVGRARSVVMSLNYDNYYLPRSDRFFHSI